MKTLLGLTFTFVCILCISFYFKIVIINPQLKEWFIKNPLHNFNQKDSILTPIRQHTFSTQQETIECDDSLKLAYITKLFQNGNDELYIDGQFEEYEKYKERLIAAIYSKFTLRQIMSISSISLIGWEQLTDEAVGMTHSEGYNNSSSIDIAVYCPNNLENVTFHEIFHAIYYKYFDYFNHNLELQWMFIDTYVSAYAQTELTEDVAETGACYVQGDTLQPNKKFELIKDFLAYSK